MSLTSTFVLPAGTVVQPALELPEELRSQIAAGESDFVLSRPGSRSLAKVVDGDAARLIAQFEKPSSIAQAVARFSRGREEDPEHLLEAALPLLQSLIAAGLLVEPDSPGAERIQPSLEAGAAVDRWHVVRCVQAQQDTELYLAQDAAGVRAALKICREGDAQAAAGLMRESHLLRALDGQANPRILAEGGWEGRRYLAMEWVEGVDAVSAAAEFRSRADAESRRGLLALAGSVLDAYAHLHQQQTVHGDVHPRNILVDRAGAVRLVDFGLGRRLDDAAWEGFALRGGVGFYLEPELARAMLENTPPPPASAAGEQFAVAAVLYHLLTGLHYADFHLERQQMLRQILSSPMLSFAARGLEAWPGVEEVLARALSKDPAARFPSLEEMARRWRALPLPDAAQATSSPAAAALRQFPAALVRRAGLDGSLLRPGGLPAPTASVNFGGAGIAWAIYRMACAQNDGELLALADLWCTRALSEMGQEDAFYNAEMEITTKTVAGNSLWHGASGVALAQALIAQGRGDVAGTLAAADGFLHAAANRSTVLDLTLGNAGSLLGCAHFLDLLREGPAVGALATAERMTRQLGGEILSEMWSTLDGYAPIRECAELTNLGIAHGWAGLLYATLAWCDASGAAMPPSLPARLRELAELAQPAGRGLRWEWDREVARYSMPGWCNGSAGYVYLWTAAAASLKDDGWNRLAEGAAWDAWETPNAATTLCCGAAGQAYALLHLHQRSGEPQWLRRAEELARRCADAPWEADPAPTKEFRPLSLYKGNPGIAVLAVDLERPLKARMPVFERDA